MRPALTRLLAPLAVLLALSVPAVGSGAIPSVRHLLGRSADGRPIFALELGDRAGTRTFLVVGCVHGDECAGIAVAAQRARMRPPRGVDLWIVPDLNPDGRAAGIRGNAHGVDLNRNFPRRWQRLRGVFASGRRPLSERESRVAFRLILRLHPAVSIWFHQHLDVVDEPGGSVAVERRFATLTGLRLARLLRESGSAVGWENHHFPHATAFVVDLPAGRLPAPTVLRLAHAVKIVSAERQP